jgi:hypothetical protein
MSYLDKAELTGEGVGIGERGEGITLPPLALASCGGTAHRAKHWLHSEYSGKGCEGMEVMMQDSKVVTGQVAQSPTKERRGISKRKGLFFLLLSC